MTLQIGLLGREDIGQACELFHTVFGSVTNEALWYWKYASGPRLGSVNVVARAANGSLVGHAAATVFPGVVSGVPIAMAQVCDVMVAPQARSAMESGSTYRRLMQRLQQELRAQFGPTFAYGFAGIRPFTLGMRMGFYRQVHPCRSIPFKAPLGIRTPRTWSIKPQPWGDAKLLDTVWQTRGAESAAPRVVRTAAYLDWRYAHHPTHRYQLWVIKRFFGVQGWIVTRAMPDHTICIIDTLLPPGVSSVHLMHALNQQLQESQQPAPDSLWGWHTPTTKTPNTEPIICLEVQVHHWRDDLSMPQLQPGDTDVF